MSGKYLTTITSTGEIDFFLRNGYTFSSPNQSNKKGSKSLYGDVREITVDDVRNMIRNVPDGKMLKANINDDLKTAVFFYR